MSAALENLLPVTREWGETAVAAHCEVHQALYHSSHSDVMVRMLDDLWDMSDRKPPDRAAAPPGRKAAHP